MKPATCKRRGCRRHLPPAARAQGDPYCSAVCCRLSHGLDAAETRWGRACKGCGCPHDEYTDGCSWCENRATKRGKRVAA